MRFVGVMLAIVPCCFEGKRCLVSGAIAICESVIRKRRRPKNEMARAGRFRKGFESRARPRKARRPRVRTCAVLRKTTRPGFSRSCDW